MRILKSLVICLLIAGCSYKSIDLNEASISDLHDQMQRREISSEELVNWYLARIEAIDRHGPTLNAIIEINPDALQIARALDEEWQRSGPRGPLHGIPVILKANIDTADRLHTTAGSMALADHIAANDAFVVKRLRDAGMVILGKANLSEWANFRSNEASSGWSSLGGQTLNPYAPARNPCGSSSGSAVAVAANLVTVAIGTETDGSVVCPSGMNGIVGIKPTLGMVSRSGIIPIAASQDTAGAMARTVRDAAMLLDAMAGTDPADDVTSSAASRPTGLAHDLAEDGLAGKRIGVIRSYDGAGSNPEVEAIYTASIATIKAQGAEVVDDIKLDMQGVGEAEFKVLLYEFKDGLNRYLEAMQKASPQGSEATPRSLADIIEYNEVHSDKVMPFFGQDTMVAAEAKGTLDDAQYRDALALVKRVSQAAIDGALAAHSLDALIAPTNGPAWLTDHINGDSYGIGSSTYAAVSGYPSVTVPAGFVHGLPVGLSFIGPAYSDKALIELAYAFEQASHVRRPPKL